ncbi:MAG: desulfoferrodoxin [Candidatus Thermoplasmatota archaeon]
MTNRSEIYKCEICGNIVAVLHAGMGDLVCCGQPMKLLKENTADASKEKHVPVIERGADGLVTVKVGSAPHPMEEKHYIEWIELIAEGRCYFKFLRHGDKPEAQFMCVAGKISAREYCNVHGLWRA